MAVIAEKVRKLNYKKAICNNLNLWQIKEDLWEMQEACTDVRWFESDWENLVAAMDGDEDEAYEFKMAFADLEAELEQFQTDLENEWVPECFDEFFPATGGRYEKLLAYDEEEGDYFGLSPYSYSFAEEEAKKKLCRLTKKELLEAAGSCMKVVVSYLAVKYRYDCLEASLKILQGKNMERIKLCKAITEAYEEAEKRSDGFSYNYCNEVVKLNRLLDSVPQEYWIQ